MLNPTVYCAFQVKAEVAQEIEAAQAEPMPSPFEAVPDAVSTEAADQVHPIGRMPSRSKGSVRFGPGGPQGSLALAPSKSLRRMPSVSRRDSLVAVGSGAVGVGDIHHLEEEVDVDIGETIQE